MKRNVNHSAAKAFLLAAVLPWLALAGMTPRAAGQEIPYSMLTITNPTPNNYDLFGGALAALGEDRMLVGVYADNGYAGAAYLYSVRGELLATFTNHPGETLFGCSVAAVGTDRLLIGACRDSLSAPYAGAAYLFLTNGTLLANFTNPTPNPTFISDFGLAVAPFGVDRALIGAPYVGPAQSGAAFLFDTNGTLLTTFTKPASARPGGDYFGNAVTALGTDRVLVGAPGTTVAGPTNVGDPYYSFQGAAFLYTTNGTHLTTFTNPVPHAEDHFGFSVAAVGSDRVLIGAAKFFPDEGPARRSAYLFSTNGTLLMTFTSPAAAIIDSFGYSLAVVGTDKLVFGGRIQNTNPPPAPAGAVYVFSTNGLLQATITNPSGVYDLFGCAVAALGSDQVIVGSDRASVGAMYTGAAYLFTLGYPPLSISGADTSFTVGWNSVEPGLVLQQADTLSTPTLWEDVPGTPEALGTMNTFSLSVPPEVTSRFYKLRRP